MRAVSRLTVVSAIALTVVAAAPTAAADEADVERYFDEVALELSEPGVWVDPDVVDLLSDDWETQLDAAATDAPADIRIAVVPAAKLDPSGSDSSYSHQSLWPGEEIASQLYDRVGVDGVYAVLVSADSEAQGRGFHAVQHAEDGPTYHVDDAIDQAVECCAPSYGPMLERFIDRASEVDRPFYVDAAPWAGGAAGAFGLWWGGTAWTARRRRHADEQRHLDVVRPMLNEEVIELSDRVSTLPTTADIEQAKLSREVLDTVEKARHRLDTVAGDEDVQGVTSLLGSARYKLTCLVALQNGKPIPEPTPPCFFDPRHGPSTQERQWTPGEGAEREVPVCDDCAGRLDAKQAPVARRAGERSYWDGGEDLVAYIEGYWTGTGGYWRFPHDRHSQARSDLRSRWDRNRPRGRLSQFSRSVSRGVSSAMAESSSNNDRRRGGGRGRSRRRSFGGGSSRRSSRRSGGSRGF